MARKFLYVVAVCVVLFILARLALIFYAEDLTEMAFVPDGPFRERPALAAGAYDDPKMWIARPGMKKKDDPAQWLPAHAQGRTGAAKVSVFFIHPTSYMEKDDWNASLDDAASRERARIYVQTMASPFNAADAVWAPRYRQAAIGAFFTDRPEAGKAIDLAYRDVLAAFDVFIRNVPQDQPIVLAGHSQGALLLRRLMRDRVAGTPLAGRIAAAYVVGWQVSARHDLPAMGLPACETAAESGCVMSWLTVADPADTSMLMKAYDRQTGLDGQPVRGSDFLCTNPLTGTRDGSSDAAPNTGTLVPDFKNGGGELVEKVVPAACEQDHFLHIGPPPKLDLAAFVLPGNNYHVYDLTLFWANLRSDFARRTAAWHEAHR
ncbi:DUF3089 domain-containing protein [Novosphingobium mangrovi (ex Huang et al. 2023)]|uniref:DUF3089 domain-containing protein n=1 Tax=Novosphingobium mangrovi (ex Huang et al. 2023) TaxID=2976432 RepID=A0ABT2I0G8_9SPHN|nr:DUF3089 domain-containing protein [Novosphingobium mangrovi (ex Huang et al. 2023)]MCT2398297.1 DUF3089 domain-containing protein [Novosphingobium mangrovi (ex Huang et al. 2023)]